MEPDDELIIHGINIKKMFGDPPRLLGMPVVISATIPDNMIAFGDTTPVEFGESPLKKVVSMKISPHPGVDYSEYDEFRISEDLERYLRDETLQKAQRYTRDETLRAFGIPPDEFDKQIPDAGNITAKELIDINERLMHPKDDDYLARALVAEKRVKELEKENNRLRLQVMRRGRK